MSVTSVEEILVLHHSHLDVGYTHAQPVVWQLQGEYITQAVEWLEATADLPVEAQPKWTCEAYEPVLRWLRAAPQSQIDRFVALHQAGRIGVAALRWNVSALPDRPGLNRLIEGKRELEAVLGSRVSVACQHDVPGAQWALADVLLDAGVDMLIMGANLHSGRPVQPRPGMFGWEAPSGRTLRVFNGHHYTMFDQLLYSWDDSVDRMQEGWEETSAHLQRSGYSLPFLYLSSTCSPVMWDNAPPNPYLPGLIQRWNERGEGPTIRYATFDDLRDAASVVPHDQLEVRRGDWTDYWTFGAGSTPTATSASRHAKARLHEVAAIGTDRRDVVHTAQERTDLFDEHTWGFFDPSPANPQAVTTELLKRALAHEADELAGFALMSGLEALAENPPADRGLSGVLVVNAADHARTVHPEIPEAWFRDARPAGERTYRARRMAYDSRPWRVRLPNDEVRRVQGIELPARSYRIVPFAELRGVQSSTIQHHTEQQPTFGSPSWDAFSEVARVTGTIETPFHRVQYDGETGRIVSLFDIVNGAELTNTDDEYDFFEFVRERADAMVDGTREAFYKRDLDGEKFDQLGWDAWRPIRERARRPLSCSVVVEDDRATLTRRIDAPGLSFLTQRFTFSSSSPVIEVDVEFELLADTTPQAIYFVTPLNMPANWSGSFDSAGEVVRLDDDQLEGACRGWATVETFAAISGSSLTQVLFTPDAPLVQFGTFHFGPPMDRVPRDSNPRMLAWAYNNYWMTNYPLTEPGVVRLRFGFASYAHVADQELRERAYDFAHAPIIWPVTTHGRSPGAGRLTAPSAV
ncbi:hypothetical protein JOE59_001967 [Agromyces cerinus]|uniref:glycoside hydrolase family 38 N-terminal domain-containing protein n=1 Tax=Agromyces cerinus TaxID=33878 RepID=UPI003639F587|nr:hypothetical protein [Agromyces cerinus]